MKSLDILKEELKSDLSYMKRALEVLEYSLEKANKIGIKKEYHIEELDVFEALTSRYARAADILTQKIIKTMFMIMQEDGKTFIDRCNLCEKLDIIEDAQELYNIRKLRNDIAHEYCISDITEIFRDVLEFSHTVLSISKKVDAYIAKTLSF